VTERMRSWIQVVEMSFLQRGAGFSLRDGGRSSTTRRELGVELLLLYIERSQLRGFIWLGCLLVAFLWRCFTGTYYWEDGSYIPFCPFLCNLTLDNLKMMNGYSYSNSTAQFGLCVINML